ncbi:efflux transporter outer membrane subunit [Azohydromonas caseinilytica]|uniref:Efflux transporter outer membrane subunit n=1 Tax=Azohydromonas caseinilytica TaxID=2728836 RepID=A0A848FAU5_9BURK|nr:efflux transporter outer membrane subunit [Azohydromonas caseinilytica]NML15559.1 efflux transporter outer membrane subunit [Azohydromonas caseinilytica]
MNAFALRAAALAAVLFVAACASPGPSRPQAPLLDAPAVGLQPDAATALSVDPAWWRGFNDAQLDTLVDRAVAEQPNLQAAQARIARAVAAAEAAGARAQPSVSGSFDATRQRFSANGIYPPPLGGGTFTVGTLQAGLQWELDFFGRHRAELAAALGSERAARADADAARVLLAAQVTRAYVGLARLQAQREVARQTLAQRESLLGLVRQRVQNGLDTTVELRQSEGGLPEARLQIEQLDEQIALARHQLAALTAQPPQALQSLDARLGELKPLALPGVLGADLLGRRADIAAARERVEAAVQDVKAARAQFYPDVNLTAFIGFNAIGLDRLIEAGSRQYGVGPAIRLPLFDAGRLRAQLHGRQAELDAAVLAYNNALLEAVREAADALATLQSLQAQRREQAAAQDSAEAAYRLAVQRYGAGLSSQLTVLSAEGPLLAQRRLAAELQARSLEAQVALLRALGGGWQPQPVSQSVAAR